MKTILVSLLLITLTEAWTVQPLKVRSITSSSSTSLHMGLRTSVKRVRDSILNKERSREDLKIGIAGFYDRSSKLWEDVWGEVRQDAVKDDSFDKLLTSYILLTAHASWILHPRKPYRPPASPD